MNLRLRVWRQAGPSEPGRMVEYDAPDISPDMSFLEMLDVVNERLVEKGEEPIAFAHDCREGICGSCSLMINGMAHGSVRHAVDHERARSANPLAAVVRKGDRLFALLHESLVDDVQH